MNKDIERGEHTLCSRSSKCLLLHCNGIFLGSGNIPQTTRDHTWPQSTQENIGQEGLRTGQRQAFCFSYSCGNSPCSTAVYTAAQCFFSSLPQVTALVQAMESHTGQVKESPQAQKLHALLEPKTLVPTTCIASSVLIGDMLNYKSHQTQVQSMVYLQVFRVSPHPDGIYQSEIILTMSNFAYVTQLA